MQRTEAIELGTKLLRDHGLNDWRMIINDRTKSRLGCCKYNKKTIEVSGWCFVECPEKVENTVRHEVAHAIAKYAGHGPEWKRVAISIGADPRSCTRVNRSRDKFKWECACTKCGAVTRRTHRRRSQRIISTRRSNCCYAGIQQREIRV